MKRRITGRIARMPLRWRVALVSLALLAVLMGALGTLISISEQHVLVQNEAAALVNEARLAFGAGRGVRVATRAPGAPVPGDDGTLVLDPHLDSAAFALAGADTRVTIYGTDGSVLATSNDLPQVPPAVTISPVTLAQTWQQPQSGGIALIARAATGERELVVLLPLSSQGHTVAVLALSTPTAAIDAAVATTRWLLALGILAALAIAAALTPLLVRAALRPLEAMERATARIAEGDLSQRLAAPAAEDEVGHLTRSFNAMVVRLDAAFTRQKRFVADVSHELRTPLTALGGGLEMLLMGADQGDAEASRRLLRGMYTEVERMRRLVRDLLTLARLDEGQMGLRRERLAPGEVLRAIAEDAQRLARGQRVSCEVAPDVPAILADPDVLRQVLLVLVDNAVKFTPAGGLIALAAVRDASGEALISVRDSGSGITPEDLPHVFDRFYRADAARARAGSRAGGSGLGLAIAKGLVEASGGTITIASVPDRGTSIALRYPAAALTRSAAPPLQGAGLGASSSARQRVEGVPQDAPASG